MGHTNPSTVYALRLPFCNKTLKQLSSDDYNIAWSVRKLDTELRYNKLSSQEGPESGDDRISQFGIPDIAVGPSLLVEYYGAVAPTFEIASCANFRFGEEMAEVGHHFSGFSPDAKVDQQISKTEPFA